MQCPKCQHEFYALVELPFSALYPLEAAVHLIPFPTIRALRDWIRRRHPEWTPWYRTINHKLVRFISSEQMVTIREESFRQTYTNPRRTSEQRAENNAKRRQHERNARALAESR